MRFILESITFLTHKRWRILTCLQGEVNFRPPWKATDNSGLKSGVIYTIPVIHTIW